MHKITLLFNRLKEMTKDLEIHNKVVLLVDDLQTEVMQLQKEITKLQKEVAQSCKKVKK